MGFGMVNVPGGGGSAEKLNNHIADKNNPHGVTAAQVGAAGIDHTHTTISFIDDRTTAVNPVDTEAGISVHLKNNSVDGLNDGNMFHSIVVVRSWADMTGPKVHELGLTDNGHIAHRYSTGDDTWSDWKQIATTSDLAGATVNSANRILEDYQAYDLNTLADGFRVFKCDGNSTNTPVSGKFGHVLVMQASSESAYAIQIYICEQNSDGIWKRYQSGGTWTEWVRIIDSSNISSQNVNYSSYSSFAGNGSRGTPGTSCLRDISAGTSDLTAGSSALTSGNIYLVYE